MDKPFWIALLSIAVFAVYVAGKVLAAMKKSERQWRDVDKSKLRTWADDEDD